MKEEWRDIKGYEGLYQVSNMGRIKALKKIRGVQIQDEKILKPHCRKDGYYSINLCKNGRQKNFLVHRLVANAFINKHFTVNHKDGNKANNTVDNLEWVTLKENNIHAYQTNLKPQGTQRVDSKLNSQQIQDIRKTYTPWNRKFSERALAKKYKVSPAIIHRIVNNQSYKNIK